MSFVSSTFICFVFFCCFSDVKQSATQVVIEPDKRQEFRQNEVKEDPTETSGYFEGDIVGVNDTTPQGRNAVVEESYKWPNGVVPYEISSQFRPHERQLIEKALRHIAKTTCIKYVPRKTELDYVDFVKKEGCSSTVGRRGGRQEISLGKSCITFGIILHESMHTLGFWHEQSREDRDKYVRIIWDNIKKGMESNFNKYSQDEITHLDLPYDIKSVMHYGPTAFSKNKFSNTLVPLKFSTIRFMGQRKDFSAIDILKINKLYNCRQQRISYDALERKDGDRVSQTANETKEEVKENVKETSNKPGLLKSVLNLFVNIFDML